MEKRLQIDFSEKAYSELVTLQKRLDVASKSELIRSALGVLKWVADEVAANNRLVVERPDGSAREVVFHFLDRIRPNAEEATPNELAAQAREGNS